MRVHAPLIDPPPGPLPHAFRATAGVASAVMMVLVALAVGCASPGPEAAPIPPAHELAEAPDWVLRGCANTTESICGVGSMGSSRNLSLARTTAIGRARTEIARSLEVKVEAMLKDYQATTTGGEEFGTAAADEQHIVDVSRQITQMSLTGTEMKALWISPENTVFALVELDVERFQQSVAEMKQLSEALRVAIQERSRSAFAELEDETSPRGAGPLALITEEEAALPDEDASGDTPVWGRRQDSPDGPQIVIRSPDDGGTYAEPFPIDVEFAVGPSGQPVDMGSLKLEYKKAWGIDITSRVREYITGTQIQVDEADLPSGRHKIEISIEDAADNRSSRLFTVVVQE